MRDVRTRFGSVLKGVFYGSDFVDWLLDVGLSQSRQDAVIYGRHLVTGNIGIPFKTRRRLFDIIMISNSIYVKIRSFSLS